MKKNNQSKNNVIIPIFSPQQIINQVNGPFVTQKSLSK